MKKLLLSLCIALMPLAGAWALQSPDEVIAQTTEAVRAKIGEKVSYYRENQAAFYEMVDAQVVQYFDTGYIAKVILGKHLKDATPEQVTRFEAAFKNLLIRQYADQLLEHYDNVQIKPRPASVKGNTAKVQASLERPNRQPIALLFSMREKDGVWKVWDIKVENISLVLNFRTQIDSEITKSSVSAVIDRMESGQLQVAAPETSGETTE